MKNQINLEQLRTDLASLSKSDFEIKYPGLKSKSLQGLSVEELEQRVSKQIISSPGGFSIPLGR